MDHTNFNYCMEILINLCRDLLETKNVEYSRGKDKLHNFKKAAQFSEGNTQMGSLKGMMLKHTVSIYDMIDDRLAGKKHSPKLWEEKIVDHINYLILLYAMAVEEYDT